MAQVDKSIPHHIAQVALYERKANQHPEDGWLNRHHVKSLAGLAPLSVNRLQLYLSLRAPVLSDPPVPE